MRSPVAPFFFLAAALACGCLAPMASAEPPASSLPPLDITESQVAYQAPHLELIDDDLRPYPTYAQGGPRGGGRWFVLGTVGERYRVRIVNPTASRVEAVVSVDGLDAIDGRPANVGKRGYLIPAYGEVTVDGWRTSLDTVAAFRFSSVRASYAARTRHDRNVGVIGVAFFRERVQPVPQLPRLARPSPASPPARSAPLPAPSDAPPPSAGAGASRAESSAEERPGLGTEFGESHDSRVTEVPFYRASSRPEAVFEVRYDDADGLASRGIRAPTRDWRQEEENDRRDRAQPFSDVRFAQPPP
jgi:hypothetical protein